MYDYLDSDKKYGVMTGIICFVFGAAVIAAAVVISYLLIWQNITHNAFVDKFSAKIFLMTITCLFLGIGAICDIVSGCKACVGDQVAKGVVVLALLFGGLVPGIMLFLFNELWAAGLYSSSTYSGGSTGGSSGGTTYSGGSGKPKRPKYDRDDDERIVRKTSKDDDDETDDTPRRVKTAPKGKRFTKAGKPE